jgi:hypothetical protein
MELSGRFLRVKRSLGLKQNCPFSATKQKVRTVTTFSSAPRFRHLRSSRFRTLLINRRQIEHAIMELVAQSVYSR